MGGFTLSKMKLASKSRRSSLRIDLSKSRRSSTPPTPKEEEEDTIDDAASQASIAVVTLASVNDDSTISSGHSDSLTSFAGNLSPHVRVKYRGDLISLRNSRSGSPKSNEAIVVDDGGYNHHDSCHQEERHRQLPAVIISSSKSANNKVDITRTENAAIANKSASQATAAALSIQSASRTRSCLSQKSKTCNPANEMTPPAISGPAATTPNHPLTSSSSVLMDNFTAFIEIDQDRNDEEHTIMTMELLGRLTPIEKEEEETTMGFSSLLECMDSFSQPVVDEQGGKTRATTADDDDDEHSMVSLFDDEGNQFVFQGDPTPSEVTRALASDRGGSRNTTDQQESEMKKAHMKCQSGAVVKHLNALYKSRSGKKSPTNSVTQNRIIKIQEDDEDHDIIELQNMLLSSKKDYYDKSRSKKTTNEQQQRQPLSSSSSAKSSSEDGPITRNQPQDVLAPVTAEVPQDAAERRLSSKNQQQPESAATAINTMPSQRTEKAVPSSTTRTKHPLVVGSRPKSRKIAKKIVPRIKQHVFRSSV